MNHWLVLFQPFATDWQPIRQRQLLRDYFLRNPDVKNGDKAFWIAGEHGLCGWGHIRKIRADSSVDDEKKMYVELSLDYLNQGAVTLAEIWSDPVLQGIQDRAGANFVLLEPKEVNLLNHLLRQRGAEAPEDIPEFQEQLGKFGVKDNTSFSHELNRAAEGHGLASVLFLDLDNFKSVNDEFDHETGDKVIKQTLDIVQRVIDERGQLFHRSGDEMMVLLPNANDSESMKIAEKIRQEIEGYNYPIIGQGIITATIGSATWPDTCQNLEDLESTADRIMLKAKKVKRGARAKITPIYTKAGIWRNRDESKKWNLHELKFLKRLNRDQIDIEFKQSTRTETHNSLRISIIFSVHSAFPYQPGDDFKIIFEEFLRSGELERENGIRWLHGDPKVKGHPNWRIDGKALLNEFPELKVFNWLAKDFVVPISFGQSTDPDDPANNVSVIFELLED